MAGPYSPYSTPAEKGRVGVEVPVCVLAQGQEGRETDPGSTYSTLLNMDQVGAKQEHLHPYSGGVGGPPSLLSLLDMNQVGGK